MSDYLNKMKNKIKSGVRFKKLYIWHNTRIRADEYFICYGNKVLIGIPKAIGRVLPHVN